MIRVEKLFSFFMIIIIILVIAPTFFIPIIDNPYDWLVKLLSLSLRTILFVVPLVILFKDNLGMWFFVAGSILLIPQSISDCGLLHEWIPNFQTYEVAYDMSITVTIFIMYSISLILLYKRFKNN